MLQGHGFSGCGKTLTFPSFERVGSAAAVDRAELITALPFAEKLGIAPRFERARLPGAP
jgi:hypothetical protein